MSPRRLKAAPRPKPVKRCPKHALSYVRTERAATKRGVFRILSVMQCTKCGKTVRLNEKGNVVTR